MPSMIPVMSAIFSERVLILLMVSTMRFTAALPCCAMAEEFSDSVLLACWA